MLAMSLRRIIALVLWFELSSCTTLDASRKPLPIEKVVELCKAGTPPPLIIQRIRDSHTTYALRGADFAKLKAHGVPDPVLDYLQQSFVDDLVLQTRYSITGEIILGGCSWCYPQPVDVDKLESGFGVVAATPPGQYQIGRPMGTPDWLPYPQHPPSGASIAVSDIEQMSRDGVPEAQIIEQIKHAPLTGLIGAGGASTVRTQPAVGLRGSTLALLYEQGVAYSVLNALQEQFLAQFIGMASGP
jgi:hypothetical protein